MCVCVCVCVCVRAFVFAHGNREIVKTLGHKENIVHVMVLNRIILQVLSGNNSSAHLILLNSVMANNITSVFTEGTTLIRTFHQTISLMKNTGAYFLMRTDQLTRQHRVIRTSLPLMPIYGFDFPSWKTTTSRDRIYISFGLYLCFCVATLWDYGTMGLPPPPPPPQVT